MKKKFVLMVLCCLVCLSGCNGKQDMKDTQQTQSETQNFSEESSEEQDTSQMSSETTDTTENVSETDMMETEMLEGHIHDYVNEWKTNNDVHWQECACGEKDGEQKHTYSEWEVVQTATETETGIKKRICSVCNYEETASVSILQHTHEFSTEWKTDDGSHWQECACGEKNGTKAHSYENWVVTKEATETEAGSKYHVCKECGYKETVTISQIGHVHEYSNTWKYNSSTHWNECACSEKGNSSAHTYSDWIVKTKATCTTNGLKERTCTECGYKETSNASKTAHKSVTDVGVKATCTTAGKTEGAHCSECGMVLTAQVSIPAKGHGTKKYTKRVEPTCTMDGKTEGISCKDCGEVIQVSEKIPALGHLERISKAVEATCTTDGMTEEKSCERCKKVLAQQQVVKATGHKVEYLKYVEVTCTTDGRTGGSYCLKCDMILEKPEVIACTGHTYRVSTTVIPSCTEDGSEQEYCKACDTVISNKVLPATGHTIEIVHGKDATCVTEGRKSGERCSKCGTTLLEQEKYYAEHNYVNGVCIMCKEKKGEIPNFANKDYPLEVMIDFVVDAIIKPGMSEFEKAITIHDWLTYNVDYDYDNLLAGTVPQTSYNASGALKTKRAVCAGYAKTFHLLAEAAGLEVTSVFGEADNGTGYAYHDWNQVKINGTWYNVDVTWDDAVWVGKDFNDHSRNHHDYFLISDAHMGKDHKAISSESGIKNCPMTYDRDVILNYKK